MGTGPPRSRSARFPQADVMFTLPGGQTLPGGRLQDLSSASSCADPMCLMSRDLRREEYTIRTAVAPDAVFTVRTYGDTAPPYDPELVRRFTHNKPQTCRSAR